MIFISPVRALTGEDQIDTSSSSPYTPALLKGMVLHENQPLRIDFVLDDGDAVFSDRQRNAEAQKLVQYFLTSLAFPEDQLWVNLSPYEKDRVIPDRFAQTDMGRLFLEQDYMLKQITSSMLNPDSERGQRFWQAVYATQEYPPTSDVSTVDVLNKVWVAPAQATIYEKYDRAFIVDAPLQVLLEEDLLEINQLIRNHQSSVNQLLKRLIIPGIEYEVNHSVNFSDLRQIYHAFVLASWYKQNLKNTPINQYYSDQMKMRGLETKLPVDRQSVYQRYLKAFHDGAFHVVKEDYDQSRQRFMQRKYFSGGVKVSYQAREQQQKLTRWSDNIYYFRNDFLISDAMDNIFLKAVLNEALAKLNNDGWLQSISFLDDILTDFFITKVKPDLNYFRNKWKSRYSEAISLEYSDILKNIPVLREVLDNLLNLDFSKSFFLNASENEKLIFKDFPSQLRKVSITPEILNHDVGMFRLFEATNRSEKPEALKIFDFVTEPFLANAFNFNQKSENDFLWKGQLYGVMVDFISQRWPFARNHFLIVPDRQKNRPQVLQYQDIQMAARFVKSQIFKNFRIGFSSLQSGPSVNQIHFQAYSLSDELSPLENVATNLLYDLKGVSVEDVLNYPVKGLIFSSNNTQSLSQVAYQYIRQFQYRNIAHSVTFAPDKIYVMLVKPNYISTFGNIRSFYEHSGLHFLINKEQDLSAISERTMWLDMEKMTISKELFDQVKESHFMDVKESQSSRESRGLNQKPDSVGGITFDQNYLNFNSQGQKVLSSSFSGGQHSLQNIEGLHSIIYGMQHVLNPDRLLVSSYLDL